MYYIQPRYINFYKAMCAWNHKKNFSTFKQLFKYCAEPWARQWQKPWIILKNTLNGRYKEIEKIYKIPLDK